MLSLTLLVSETDTVVDDNYLRFANTLLSRGHRVYLGFMDSLAMQASQVTARLTQVHTPLLAGEMFPETQAHPLADMDVVWVLSLGLRHNFLDKFQLLRCLPAACQLINSLDGLMHFKSKYFLASQAQTFQHPEVHADTDANRLFEHMRARGGRWIAKPPAGSLGRSVFLLSHEDPNARVILETLTDGGMHYCLLQPYVDEIEQGEKRVLIAGGKAVGQYLRHAALDHRSNRMQGARISSCKLTDAEIRLCDAVGALLLRHGVMFAGMDLAHPWVIEFNVVNPGGLHTVEELTGEDLSGAIIDSIMAEVMACVTAPTVRAAD